MVQICMYTAWSFSPEKLIAIFYFDPRIGLYFIESEIRGTELTVPGILQWLSAIWLLLISLLLLSGRSILKTYIISEIIVLIPTLFFCALIVLANLSTTHGFSIGELFFPVLVMMLFTIVPVILAITIWRKDSELMKYVPIDPMSREDVEAVLARGNPEELLRAVLAVALHDEDNAWATSICLRLASHNHFNVRGNAILGLGHLARRYCYLDPAARGIIEAGLQDDDPYVRGQADAAADDVEHFLGWEIKRPN